MPRTMGMPDDNRPSFPARSVKPQQEENVRTPESAAMASYTLIGAIILLGGIGFGLDQWLGTTPWLLLGGLLLGLIVGFYELAKAVFWRQ